MGRMAARWRTHLTLPWETSRIGLACGRQPRPDETVKESGVELAAWPARVRDAMTAPH